MCVDLATSNQFCPHLDENNLKSTFLKIPSYTCAHNYLKIGGLNLAKCYQFDKLAKVWHRQNLGLYGIILNIG